MCTEHKIALTVINKYIEEGNRFTYDELTKEIILKGGILRTSIGVTIRMYLDRLQSVGLLVYDPSICKFEVHKEILDKQLSLV